MFSKLGQIGVDVLDLFRSRNFSYNVFWKLKKAQYLPREELDIEVDRRLRKLLLSTVDRVPFYQDLYSESGINREDLKKIDLSQLPETTKPMLRNNSPDSLRAKGLEHRAIYNTTSGSTGEPFEFYNDVYAFPDRQASFMLFNTWMGVHPHDTHIAFKSPSHLTNITMLRDRIFGKNRVSVLDVNRKDVHKIVERINEVDPAYIEGYTASLVQFVRYVDELGLDLKAKPKAVIATSEDLIERHRKTLEDVFNAKVFNRYGSREFCGAVAQECGICNGFHVNTLLSIVEIVDETGKPVAVGERGKVLITDLTNFVYPFIRYDIGDSAVKEPETNDCDITFPRFSDLIGREGQFIVAKNGERTPFITISAYLFRKKYAPHVFNYQFEQTKPGELLLRIIPTRKYSHENKQEMYAYLEEALPGFNIEVELVDEIPTTSSGKRPFLIKNINS